MDFHSFAVLYSAPLLSAILPIAFFFLLLFFERISTRRVTYPVFHIHVPHLALNMTGWLSFIHVTQKLRTRGPEI